MAKTRGVTFRGYRSMKSRSVLGLRATKIAGKVKGALTAARDVAHMVNEISGKPKFHNYAAIGTIALHKITDYFNFDPSTDPTMREPLFVPYEMKDFFRKIAQQHPTETHGVEGGQSVQVSTVGEQVVVFRGSGWDVAMWFQIPVEDDHEAAELKAIRAFGRATWESLGSKVEAVTSDKKSHQEDLTYIKAWNPGEILKSDQTAAVLARTKMFLDRGHSRSILLYGPPGTGKTCMIRAIADEIPGTTLFLDSAQLGGLDSQGLSFFLDYLAPDIVLIDDLDRVEDVKSLLSAVDRIRARCKLLMVTVNHLGEMDPAVVRAGRFTDQIEVLRAHRTGAAIAGLDPEVLAEIDEWPIAFIEELKARREVLPTSQFQDELDELRKRVKANG